MSGHIISCTMYITISYMTELKENVLEDGGVGEGVLETAEDQCMHKKMKCTNITLN